MIGECLWHVQRSVLGAVWIKKSGLWLLRGCLDCLEMVYVGFYGLYVAGFVSWFVIVCGMSKKLFLGAIWIKRKIRLVKGLFGQFYGQFKGLFGQFLCPVKGCLGCFVGTLHATLCLES